MLKSREWEGLGSTTNLPTHFSPSSLTCYLNCPRDYFYKYVAKLKLPGESVHLLFGDAVHKAFEEGKELFLKTFDKSKLEKKEWEKYEKLKPVGEKIVELWSEKKDYYYQLLDIGKGGSKELTVEGYLRNPLTQEQLPIPVRGRIDELSSNKKINEYKTSAKPYNERDEAFKFQTLIYDLWHYLKYGYQAKEIIYFVFVKDLKVLESDRPIQIIRINHSLEDLAEGFMKIKSILTQIEQGYFKREKCKPYCDCRKFDRLLLGVDN